jgi:hypothetical protein
MKTFKLNYISADAIDYLLRHLKISDAPLFASKLMPNTNCIVGEQFG